VTQPSTSPTPAPPPGGRAVLLAIGLVFLVGLAIGFVLGRTV